MVRLCCDNRTGIYFIHGSLIILFLVLSFIQVMGEELNVPPSAWQEAVTGVHRRQLLLLAAQALAGLYKKAVQAKVEEI